MATKLFIGSLAWATNDDSLKDFFAGVGTVVSASVIMDRETNRSKGFGFVEMSSDEEAKKAVERAQRQRPRRPSNRCHLRLVLAKSALVAVAVAATVGGGDRHRY